MVNQPGDDSQRTVNPPLPGAVVVARSSNFAAYGVYFNLEVVGFDQNFWTNKDPQDLQKCWYLQTREI